MPQTVESPFRLDNRVAFVTGGGQGIGRAICYVLARAGAAVAIADVDVEAGTEAADELKREGLRALFMAVDVAAENEVAAAMAQVDATWGRLDILCNNAGIGAHGSIDDLTKEAWDRVLSVNLSGPFLTTKYALPLMRKAGGGAVVNIASTRALMSEANTEPYSASKGGLLALTHALAVSLGPENIRVNAISPGWIETGEWKKSSARYVPQLRDVDHAQHPAGRVGRPEDIAHACLFLVSPASGFITGANLVIDGGMTVKMIYEP